MKEEIIFIDQRQKCNNEDGEAQNNVLWKMLFVAYTTRNEGYSRD